ncbi:MAG: type IV pilin [Candidatus Thermoplasmatota archaeon]|nr:type IV pilin [Candidatus Thermoplasmatota archaeon]
MYIDVRKKKSWKNSAGVSEVVGNIMILAITVVLFSSIMAFVQQMPMPEQTTKASFSASISFWDNGEKANLTVVHAGGATLKVIDTIVLVELDNVYQRYNLSDDASMAGSVNWATGMAWKKTLEDTNYTSSVTVLVLDLRTSSLVWSSQVTGGSGGNAPNILQRYVDSNPSTPTPDAVKEWDNFTLFVTITDSDNDLNTTDGVWIDSSDLEKDGDFRKRYPDAVSGSTYRWDFLGIKDRKMNSSALDGGVVMIYAVDLKGHVSASSFVMTVTVLPVQPIRLPNPTEYSYSGDSFLPSYITWFFDNQGYGIYEEAFNGTTPMGIIDVARPNTTFEKESLVFVRVASMVLNNILAQNSLVVVDTRTNMPIQPLFWNLSTPARPFYPVSGTGGGIYIYECQFYTHPLPPSAYTMFITLKNQPSAGAPQRAFEQQPMILVEDPDSPISFWPKVTLYRDSDYSVEWGTQGDPFEVASSDAYKIYVTIEVQNTDNPPNPTVAEVRIKDMTGATELYGSPPAGNMISSVGRRDSTHYNFSIDLRMNNGVQWRAGVNSYNLFISKMNDTNEGIYSISSQVFVKGAGQRADFVIGTSGMATGQSNFNTREYVYYIQNNLLFSTRVLWLDESTPGDNNDYTVTAMAVGDIDTDGDKDILAALASSNYLMLFENTLSTFGTWQSGSMIYRPDGYSYHITWIAVGDFTGDDNNDFAYVNSNGQIVLYETKYGSRGTIYTPPALKGWSTPVSKIELADMTGDGRADLVVLGNGKIYIYDLRYTYDLALVPYFEDRALFDVSDGVTVDFDIEYMNDDNHLDIVTADTTSAYTGGYNGVNVNLYTTKPGSQTVLDYDLAGWIPKIDAGAVGSGTVENTQIIDSSAIRFIEESSGDNPGRVVMTMRFDELPDRADLQLRLHAKTGALGGLPQEVFYVWYSIDGTVFTPVLTISSATYQDYTYDLPATVMGKAIYLRITDSLLTEASGSIMDYIDLDMVGVFTDTFDGYAPKGVALDTTWKCVRGANIDGNATFLEVVVAKHHDAIQANSVWKVYRTTDGETWSLLPGQPSGDTTLYMNPSAMLSTTYFTYTAPTLFDAVDINGDGYTDILVTNLTQTAVTGYCISNVGFYMNLWTGSGMSFRYFPVHDWTNDKPTGKIKNPFVTVNIGVQMVVTG